MWPKIGSADTYGIFYVAAMVAHFLICLTLARRFSLKHRVWIAVGCAYTFGMTVGAKSLSDLREGTFSVAALFHASHWAAGGMWGGPLVYLGLAVPLAWLLGARQRAALDLTVLSLPVPLILSKMACLANGCCYGTPCALPWAITFPRNNSKVPGGVPLHPTQVYEILVLLIVLAVLWRLSRSRWQGTLLWWFLLLYGIGRPLAEVFRGDRNLHPLWGPLTLSQLICLVMAVLSGIGLIVHEARQGTAREPAGEGSPLPLATAAAECHAVPAEARDPPLTGTP
jgi:phosphatidylglycerol:prolipoprotein diacylglycerol transferase